MIHSEGSLKEKAHFVCFQETDAIIYLEKVLVFFYSSSGLVVSKRELVEIGE